MPSPLHPVAMHRIRRALRSLCPTLALLATVASAAAQGMNFETPPPEMARAAIADQPGTAVAAVWRNGKASIAGLRDGQALDAALLEGTQAPMFEIGSISKVFTGLLLAQAVERGELALDDTLGRLLEGQVAFSSADVAGITLRQLVTHTSCLPRLPADLARSATDVDPYRTYDRARLWKALADMEIAKGTSPPCEHGYSNLGFAVLGEVLAARYGKPWAQLVHENITGPLGMKDTVQALGEKAPRLAAGFAGTARAAPWEFQAFAGAGALRSTAADMLVFGKALAAGRRGPLGAAAERLVTPLARSDGEIGYGIFIRGPQGRRTFAHNGATGGYRAHLVVAQDTGEVLVVFASNLQAPLSNVGAQVIASRYPVTPGQASVEPAKLAEYAGVYRIKPDAAFTFVAQEGALHARFTGQPFVPVSPSGPDEFTLGARARIAFAREGGKVRSVTVQSAGNERRAARSDEAPPARATWPDDQLQAYVGRYMHRDRVFDVQVKDGQLSVKFAAQSRFPVFPVEGQADRFSYDVVKAEIEFERYPGGAVKSLVLHQNGRLRAEKVE